GKLLSRPEIVQVCNIIREASSCIHFERCERTLGLTQPCTAARELLIEAVAISIIIHMMRPPKRSSEVRAELTEISKRSRQAASALDGKRPARYRQRLSALRGAIHKAPYLAFISEFVDAAATDPGALAWLSSTLREQAQVERDAGGRQRVMWGFDMLVR